jgi:hypothetical protein
VTAYVHLMKHPFALLRPIRRGACARRYKWFGFGLPQHVPVSGRFAPGEIDGVRANQFADGCGVVFLFGEMARTHVEPGDGRGPIRETAIIPKSWRFDPPSARLAKRARESGKKHDSRSFHDAPAPSS